MTPVELPDSLRILAALRRLDEPGFARLLQARRVNARAVGDLLDLAEWLDAPRHVAEALARLDWPTLRDLRRREPAALERAAGLMLAVEVDGGAPEPLPETARALDAALPAVPRFTPGAEADDAGAAAAHEAAVLAVDALALLDAAPRVVRTTREGVRMSGVEVRRLAAELDRDAALVGAVYRWLHAAGLMAPLDEVWHPTAAGRRLVELPAIDRWRALVDAWLGEQRLAEVAELVDGLGGEFPLPAAPDADGGTDEVDGAAPGTAAITLPGDPAARIAAAEALGIADRGALTAAGAEVLDGRVDAAAARFAAAFPAEVTQVYLQPDQTIIAPGPLPAALDARLRRVAVLERRALASEYRITADSIADALGEGMSEAEIRELLAELSLTGVPQPVDYLIGATAERFGRVRVREHDRGGRTVARVRALEPGILDALRIDAGLRPLGLRPVDDELETSVSPAAVVKSLVDARYPAAPDDAAGRILPLLAPSTAPEHSPEPGQTVARTAAELAEQAAAGDDGDDRATWLRRRLELARRAKAPVAVTVRIDAATTQTLRLVPTAVAPQRVRARDAEAEVERTLPLSSIVAVDEL